ncbi:MAG: hypothetical protein KGN74_13150 [Gemmatimonadota bacterium]|nr:hypothetical protein [Gemmatimonadota bacterium]
MPPTRRTILATMFAAAAALSACSGGGATGPVPSAAALAGNWEFVRPANDTCYGAAGALNYWFHADSSGADAHGTMTIAAPWTDSTRGIHDWTVTGYMNRVTGKVQLDFWLVVNLAGEEFDGTIDSAGVVSGTLVDPKPGYLPHYTIVPCAYQVTGRRIIP